MYTLVYLPLQLKLPFMSWLQDFHTKLTHQDTHVERHSPFPAGLETRGRPQRAEQRLLVPTSQNEAEWKGELSHQLSDSILKGCGIAPATWLSE